MSFVFVVGLIVATATPGPLLTADDLAYFGLSWTMAGEGAVPMPAQPPYGLLYPLLLMPGWWFGAEDAGMLLWARILNAGFGALTVPVLAAFAGRLDDVEWRPALAAATAGAMMPAFLLTGSIAWSERLLVLLVALVAWALAKVWDDGRAGSAALVIVIGAAMFAAHPRLGPPALIAIVLAALAVRGLGWPRVISVLGAGGAALWLVERARSAVADAAFASSGTYDATDLASRRGPDRFLEMSQLGMGATTYLVLAGTGIVVWGVVRLARDRSVGWSVLLVGLAVLAITSWFITGIPRADKWLHGRYIEVMAPVLLTVGLVNLRKLTWRWAVPLLIALPASGGVIAAWNGPGNNWLNARSPVMMFGVEVAGAPYASPIFEPGAAASVSIAVGLLAWGLTKWRGVEVAAALLVVLSVWGAHSGDRTVDALFEGTAMGQVDASLPADEIIGEVFVDTATVSPNLTNAIAWRAGFDHTTLTFGEATTHLLIPPDATPPTGAELVAEFGQGTLWRLPG